MVDETLFPALDETHGQDICPVIHGRMMEHSFTGQINVIAQITVSVLLKQLQQ